MLILTTQRGGKENEWVTITVGDVKFKATARRRGRSKVDLVIDGDRETVKVSRDLQTSGAKGNIESWK